MPDDSKPEFKDSQTKHAQKMASERAVMDLFGLNRSQLRSGIRAGLRSFEQRVQAPATQIKQEPVTSPSLPPPQPTRFDPKPFTLQAEPAGGKGRGDDSGDIPNVILVVDGEGFEGCTLRGTLGTAI